MSMITATAWVPRGYPKQMPARAEFDQDEFDRIQELANLQLQDAQQDLDQARNGGKDDAEDASDVDGEGGVSLSRTTAYVKSRDTVRFCAHHMADSNFVF